MHKWFMFVSASALSMGVLAQARPLQPQDDAAREQRRVELRTALQAQRHPEQAPVGAKAPAGRQLTSQEHAVLREQLRQQRADKPERP